MKKLVFLLVALLLGTGAASAQGNLLNELKRQATNAVRNEVNRAKNNAQRSVKDAAKNAVRNAAENARNAASSNHNTASQQLAGEPVEVKEGAWTCPNCGKADNEGSFCPNCGTNRPDGNAPAADLEAVASTTDAQSFVPGANVIFEDNLIGETTYEAPSKWTNNAFSEDCRISSKAGETAIFLTGFYSDIKPTMKKDNYLPASFTVEMDLWCEETLQNPQTHALEFDFASEDVLEEFSGIFQFTLDEDHPATVALRYWEKNTTGAKLIENQDRVKSLLKVGAWNRVAVSYDKGKVVLYLNGESVLQVTEQKQPTYIRMIGKSSGDDGFFFKNIRIAAK